MSCQNLTQLYARRGDLVMCDQLHTPAEAAEVLRVRESWLRTKASARAIPCTFIGKHLRFSDADIIQIKKAGAREALTRRRRTA
jgi:excisionase family DNA binding protein